MKSMKSMKSPRSREGSAPGDRARRRGVGVVATMLAAVAVAAAAWAQPAVEEWIEVDYGELVDLRQPTHSGEPVGELLGRFAAAGAAPDPNTYKLLDPLLEPYAFVLSDTLDTLDSRVAPASPGVPTAPWIEVGGLWQPGEAQPAWVELLRARRFLVESDGHGALRAFLPHDAPSGSATGAEEAAREALARAWPVVRLVLAAELRRLGDGAAEPDEPALRLDVYAYRHDLGRTRFRLGTRPHRVQIASLDDTLPAGRRPPLDLAALRKFVEEGLQLEGGRLEADGSMRLLGSRGSGSSTLAGRPVALSDLAVAYRAVFHGGLAEPYMSLDRGLSPQSAIVNYGGRLRDSSLGWVSLLCDIRFKTFSVGLDVLDGSDLRTTIRDDLASFRTHYERFAADPSSGDVLDQQTRLWFYPDNVDLTVSRQGDLVAMRRVRMSAASERFVSGTTRPAGSDPPWTRRTIDAINRDYDALAAFFPELEELDVVVRLLSLFTWLRQAGADGLLVPELDALLDVELPAAATPRTFPQLLSFNALPRGEAPVDVIDRLAVAAGLDRLVLGARGPLPARRRLDRAVDGLDPERPQSGKLLQQLRGTPPDGVPDTRLDALAYEAERVRMHQTVLGTLAPADRERVLARGQRGESMRYFSIGIGGLELGMGEALSRAGGRSLGLGAGNGAAVVPAADPGVARMVKDPRPEWRREPATASASTLPPHGWPADGEARNDGRVRRGDHWVERGGGEGARWIHTVYGAEGPEARSRKAVYGADGLERVERFEGAGGAGAGGMFAYRMERQGSVWSARLQGAAVPPEWSPVPDPAPGMIVMQVGPPPAVGAAEPDAVQLRLLVSSTDGGAGGEPRRLETAFPRTILQRLVAGPAADWTPGTPLPGLDPLPGALASTRTLMLALNLEQRVEPWEASGPPVAGEEDPETLARALGLWWAGKADRPAVAVGTDPLRSTARWLEAPRIGGAARLLLPAGVAVGPSPRASLAAAWGEGEPTLELPETVAARLVVLASDEPPGLLGGRLRRLARAPAMQGKLLVVWPLAGPLRQDLPASLLAEGKLAGIAVAEGGVLGRRELVERIAELRRRWSDPEREGQRAETLGLGLLWYF
jgi:hypothetical protein